MSESPLDMWRRAKHVDLAALCIQLDLPTNTHSLPVRVKCPFHEDGDSFNLTVHTKGNSWNGPHVYCYACDYSGSAIDLVRDYLNISDREAVEYILARPLPEVKREREQTLSSTKDMTSAFYNAHLRLFGPHGGHAREYLESRGIGMDTAQEYMLGLWATDNTRWSGRLTIPHLRLPGETVLAGKGRALHGEDPKYMATRGAAQSLYLGELALRYDDETQAGIVLCEGEIDALSLHVALRGVLPVCALPGVHTFRDEHLFAGRRVYVVTDNDEAGRRARDGYRDERGWHPGIMDRLRHAGSYPASIVPGLADANEMLLAYGKDGLGEWFMEQVAQVEEVEAI